MSDSEDSNFSEEEDSERSSEAEEAEVSDGDPRGRRCAWGQGPGRGAPGAQARDGWAFPDGPERWASGQVRGERGTASGRWVRGYTEALGDEFRRHWLLNSCIRFASLCLLLLNAVLGLNPGLQSCQIDTLSSSFSFSC